MTGKVVAPGNDAVDAGASPAAIAAHVVANAGRYFPELGGGPVEVRASGGRLRHASVLYGFEVQVGDETRSVVAKIPRTSAPLPSGRSPASPDRPRRDGPPLPEHKYLLEHAALTAIHGHFTALGDPRFGAVRPLDLLREHHAVIMETASGISLRKLYHGFHRGRGHAGVSELEKVFRNTGAWLRAYHDLTPPAPVRPLHATRADLVDFIGRLTAFLGDRLGDAVFFRELTSLLSATAHRVLPDRLPLGLGHGDFAPRNVLVGPDSRVTVLDTLARSSTPIYEDLGYFLVSLRYNWPQVLSAEAAFPATRVAACEGALLSGYFADAAVPHDAVRLHTIQAMLDLWSATAWRYAQASGHRSRFTEGVKLTLLSRLLRRRLREELDGPAARS